MRAREGRKILAITHAATALLVKRQFPDAPMTAILLSVELPAILWAALELSGIEQEPMRYSHSVLSLLLLACALWLLLAGLLRRRALGAAVALGIVLHLLLDLALLAQTVPLAPFGDTRIGLALYATPPLAIAAAMAYGLLCWLVFRGEKALLAAILALTIAEFSFPVPAALAVALAASGVWFFSRARAAELEHPDRRLARAFA